jgi:hypothetical protein
VEQSIMRTIALTVLMLGALAVRAPAQSKDDSRVDLTGTWALTVTSQGQSGTSEVTLIQRGDSLIGRYTSQTLGDLEVVGSVKGREFAFAYSAAMNGQPLTVNVKGIVQNPDSLTGTATMGPLGSATFSAKRAQRR